jgi:hypothetical protein
MAKASRMGKEKSPAAEVPGSVSKLTRRLF